jgi:hypothetical protein
MVDRMSRLSALGLAIVAVILVGAARLLLPASPPLYDQVTLPTPPYHYVSPPPDLATTNQQPSGGELTLKVVDGVNAIGTLQTGDKQAVAVFPKGALSVSGGATQIRVSITPDTTPPPPPAKSTMVGNAYTFSAAGLPGDQPVGFVLPSKDHAAQVLLRVPPVTYTSVKSFYDGTWHDLLFQRNPDLVFAAVDRFGDVAAFNDPLKPSSGSRGSSTNAVLIFEVGAVILAIVVIIAGVVTQRRRERV